ncbi:MAG: acyltransferase [Bacteroidetes bacterium]|nr:acyltransferase [Bacteroidota bacterium]MBU1720913.1 acyltransferase [Bacteroidota bacterium]
MQQKSKIFFENLDGLRFIAFFMVFVFHIFMYFQVKDPSDTFDFIYKALSFRHKGGFYGVSFFFVLSGFLISYLLLSELHLRGKINVAYFYMRRILRIWPLYYFVLVLGFIGLPIFMETLGHAFKETGNPWAFIFFVANFDAIRVIPSEPLGVQWSIAVEEQFYLLWPLVFRIIPRRFLLYFMLAVVNISFIFRYMHYGDYDSLGFHSLAVMNDLAIGGIAAWFAINSARVRDFFRDLPKPYIVVGYITGLVFMYCDNGVFAPMSRLGLSLFFVFVILEQCYSEHSFYKMGRSKFLTYWGKYTYGLYLYHMIVIFIVFMLSPLLGIGNTYSDFIIKAVSSLIISMAVSYASYTWFESFFLKLKHRFSYIVKS